MKVLFIGDVYMEQGRKAFDKYFAHIKQEYKPHFIIVNGENISDTNGLSEEIYKDYLKRGVNVFTLGNHAFSRRDYHEVLDPRIMGQELLVTNMWYITTMEPKSL